MNCRHRLEHAEGKSCTDICAEYHEYIPCVNMTGGYIGALGVVEPVEPPQYNNFIVRLGGGKSIGGYKVFRKF